jgi:hypothetical protein
MGAWKDGTPLADGFAYSSDTNTHWLKPNQIRSLLEAEGLL